MAEKRYNHRLCSSAVRRLMFFDAPQSFRFHPICFYSFVLAQFDFTQLVNIKLFFLKNCFSLNFADFCFYLVCMVYSGLWLEQLDPMERMQSNM